MIVRADDQVDDIYRDFIQGELIRAQKELNQLPQTAARDGNRLFLLSLYEPLGDRANDLLRAAARSNLDGKYEEEARFRMIQLAEARGDTSEVISLGTDFLDRWEMSEYREQLLAILAAHFTESTDDQERYFELLTDGFPGSYFGQFARLAGANAAFHRGHYITARTYCRRINNSSNEHLAPASLILLARIALRQGDPEKALMSYNILRERYRHAVGQEELLEALKIVSDEKSGEESIEVFEGITYSVKVGVFASKKNAGRMADRIEAYGYKAKMKKRMISGNQYYVVLAGRFMTMKEAQAARQKLEMGENEIFKVEVNDEK
jgi:hypothetical protein